MKTLRASFAVIGEFRRAFITLNLLYFGLVAAGMVYSMFNPGIQRQLLAAVGASFGAGPAQGVANAYLSQNVLAATAVTFAFNLGVGTLLVITLPSLVIPFSGLLTGAVRAFLWGILFSPTSLAMALTLVPHSLTLLLEGEGYVLALFAAYVHGRAMVTPRAVLGRDRLAWVKDPVIRGLLLFAAGYWEGLKRTLRLYLLVVLMLLAAALYEAVEIIGLLMLARRLGVQ